MKESNFAVVHMDRCSNSYAYARERHPYLCDALISFGTLSEMERVLKRAHEEVAREINQSKLLPMALINCKWLRAIKAYQEKDASTAIAELYDAIAVLLRVIDVIEGRQPLGDPAPKMTWDDFTKKYNFRQTERCCATCKHGAEGYEGECGCKHPLISDRLLAGGMINDICDLWEAAPTSPTSPTSPAP